MWDKPLRVLGLAAFAFILVQMFSFFTGTHEDVEDEEFSRIFNKEYAVFALSIPENHDFAGEAVPLHDPEVYERLDREMLVNTYWQSNGLLMLKRANRYFPLIEQILAEEGVPDDFKYLALIESGLTNVVSPAGATGFWQILKSTGQEYGLEVNKEVDERYHVERSTRAACAYLKDAHSRFGNWTLAAASYNMGMNGLARQMEQQNANSYYDLLLNSETRRYVFRILAVKKIFSDPAKFGFQYRDRDLYKPLETKELRIDSNLNDLVSFANSQGISYKTLRYYNPWLRGNSLTVQNGSAYSILIPDSAQSSNQPASEPADSSTVD